jgi:hypothetical protein
MHAPGKLGGKVQFAPLASDKKKAVEEQKCQLSCISSHSALAHIHFVSISSNQQGSYMTTTTTPLLYDFQKIAFDSLLILKFLLFLWAKGWS